MINLLYFIACTACAFLAARLNCRDRKKPILAAAAESILDGVLVFCLLYILFLFTDRMEIAWDSTLQVAFGKVPLLAGLTAAVLLGVWQGRRALYQTPAAERVWNLSGRQKAAHILADAALIVLLTLTYALIWASRTYQNISLEMVSFYLQMPLRGTAGSFFRDIFIYVIACVLAWCAAICLFFLLPLEMDGGTRTGRLKGALLHQFPFRISGGAVWLLVLTWLAVLLFFGDRLLDFRGFLNSRLNPSRFIEENYVAPDSVAVRFPEKKRNLITIYIESCESTSQDHANGGAFDVNLIPELTELAKENTSFSQSDLIEGAAVAPACGWTMAGLVAQTAGIPLKYYAYNGQSTDQIGSKLVSFLPGAMTMGDLLKDAGYRRVFMAGSDFDFGGRRIFYEQHGDYEILDLKDASQNGIKVSEEKGEGGDLDWGILDMDLYAWAKEELLQLARGDQPFHFAMLTLDTHFPTRDCPLCPQGIGSRTANIIACSSKQAAEFVKWCQAQDFMENTTIVITGDHASMLNFFYEGFAGSADKHLGTQNRLVYNLFINPAVSPKKEKNRLFTTLDIFPTTLAALGVQIEGEQLGLGVNLFSSNLTLSEKYGYDSFFEELNKKSVFYDQTLLYP